MKKKKKKERDKNIFQGKITSNNVTRKTSLKSILFNYDDNFPIINKLVIDSNEIVIQTYQFIRLYMLYKFYRNEELPIIDKEFVLYCIRTLGNRDNRGKQSKNKFLVKELDDFYEKEFKNCINKDKFQLKNKSYLIPYLAIQIQTGFNNNIKEHFITRIRRFMNTFKPEHLFDKKIKDKENKKIWNKIKNLILQDKINDISEEIYKITKSENSQNLQEFKEWSLSIKNKFLPKEYEKSYGYDVKVNPNKYIKYTILMNSEIENRNDEIQNKINDSGSEEEKRKLRTDKKKLFQPIPLRNTIIPHYITIDTNVILSHFANKGESQLNKKTKRKQRHIWLKVFNIDNKIFNKEGYKFTSIQTDGIGVSIIFEKNKKHKKSEESDNEFYIDELNDEELNHIKNRKIISADPGKQNLVMLLDENNNKLRYTNVQRRAESLRKRNKRITDIERLKNKIQEKESILSIQNSKTVVYEKFKKYIIEKTKLNEELKDFYERELFRKLKWRTHIYKRKSEDKFLNNIEKKYGKKDEIVIAYGNWSNTKQMKYIMPTMGKGLRRIIEKKFDIVLIDEYNTSKLCSKCYKELKNWNNLHRILCCNGCSGSESKNSTFINRDINACVNIFNICKDWIKNKIRRTEFKRNTNDDLKDNVSLREKHH